MFFAAGTKGGVRHDPANGCGNSLFPIFFVFRSLSLLFGFHNDDTEKSGETIATPPKRGVPTGPDSGAERHASIRPPGGRYRRYLSLREGSEKTPRSGAD